jgi:hypothetical protein
MTRAQLIEQILRQVYGGYVQEDSSITPMLVNQYIDQGIAVAARTNYTDNLKLEGISFVNNSFYTTFKNLVAVRDERNLWKITLPQVPVGIGYSEGISTVQFKDDQGVISQPCIPLTQNQKTYFQSMPHIPSKTLFYSEGDKVFVISNLILSNYTASVTMVSGGLSSSLNSVLTVPSDYMPVIIQYVQQQLLLMKSRPQDLVNDGSDLTVN